MLDQMSKNTDLQKVLRDIYGIDATPVSQLLHFDLTAVTVYSHYPDKYVVKNYGKFDMQQFQVGPD